MTVIIGVTPPEYRVDPSWSAQTVFEEFERLAMAGPPDEIPDTTERNAYRAQLAVPALFRYAQTVKSLDTDIHTTIQDLLSDLMHLCDLMGEALPVESAEDRYQEEVAGE